MKVTRNLAFESGNRSIPVDLIEIEGVSCMEHPGQGSHEGLISISHEPTGYGLAHARTSEGARNHAAGLLRRHASFFQGPVAKYPVINPV